MIKDMVRVNGILTQKILSEIFDIIRGVVKGDIVSPLLFILTLDSLIQFHDKTDNDIKCGKCLTIRVLDYVDDVTMTKERVEVMTERLTELVDVSEKEVDMKV